MHVYRLRDGEFARVRKRFVLRTLLMSLITLAVALYVVLTRGYATGTDELRILLVVALLPPLIGIPFLLSLAWSLSVRRSWWRSYRLIHTDERLIQEEEGTRKSLLGLTEIGEAREIVGRGLLLRSREGRRTLFIPEAIEDFEVLRAEVARHAPLVVTRKKRLLYWFSLVGVCLAVVAMVVALQATRLTFALPAALLFVILVAWGLVDVLRSPTIDRRIKWASLLVLIPVIAVMRRVSNLLSME